MTDDDLAYNFGLEIRYAIAAAGVDPIQHIPEVDEIIKRRIEEIRSSALTNTSGDDEAREGCVGSMTPDRAIYFLQRFKGEEKMLGPHEQWALDYAISALARPLSAAVRDEE
jgi:hypothetical protein